MTTQNTPSSPEGANYPPNIHYQVHFDFNDERLSPLVYECEKFENFADTIIESTGGRPLFYVDDDEDTGEEVQVFEVSFSARPDTMTEEDALYSATKALDDWLCHLGLQDVTLVDARVGVQKSREEEWEHVSYLEAAQEAMAALATRDIMLAVDKFEASL